MKKSEKKLSDGFTFLEVVIGLGIVMAILGAVVGIQIMVRNSYEFTFNTSITVEHANTVSGQMVRIIRNARAADNGAYTLDTVGDQELILYSNIDNDPQTERVRYFLDGTELKRGVIEPTGFPVDYPTGNEVVKILGEHIQNGSDPIFFYYNSDWPTDTVNNPLGTSGRLSDTRFIQISVKVNANPDRTESDFVLAPFAQLRNLKDNL